VAARPNPCTLALWPWWTRTVGCVLPWGDPHMRVFTRSTIKALQALPFVRGGGPAQFGFSTQQLAMLCSSHSGEPMHVEQVQGMLDKAGVGLRQLQCGCHVPMFVDMGVAPAPPAWDERHHNCSGKHAGFVAHCVQHGLPLDSYLDAGHPLQQAIRRDVARGGGAGARRFAHGVLTAALRPTTPCPCRRWRAAMRGWPAASKMRSLVTVLARWPTP
jgi:L-asparaginase II